MTFFWRFAALFVLGLAAIIISVALFETSLPPLYQTYLENTNYQATNLFGPSSLDDDDQRRLANSLNLYQKPSLYRTSLGNTNYQATNLFIPSSLDIDGQRSLANSLNLGGGDCQWQPPTYDVPAEVDFHKTIVTGFPSGDKRMVYLQMEALTGWPAKDEWDFAFMGPSNHPFIKANYPHHEGIWGWEGVADQVLLVIPNIRRSMVEYHDIVWDLGYATTWEQATNFSKSLFNGKPHLDEFYAWRDSRVLDETRWFGWFIDYWMEGGLQRDVFTHKIITHDHWQDLMNKPFYTREELNYDNYVENGTVITPSYDPHCVNGEITAGCVPVAVISADRLRDHTQGPAETTAVGTALLNDARTAEYIIGGEAWDCIWKELIITRKGPTTVYDRPGVNEDGYNFSLEMLEEMIFELNRLITKYSLPEWSTRATANRLVDILVEQRALLQIEINEVNSGMRKLRDNDFLGPAERVRRRLEREAYTRSHVAPKEEDNSRYFINLLQTRFNEKLREMRRFLMKRNRKASSEQKLSGEETVEAFNALKKIRLHETRPFL